MTLSTALASRWKVSAVWPEIEHMFEDVPTTGYAEAVAYIQVVCDWAA
jgi:hypothetical protein